MCMSCVSSAEAVVLGGAGSVVAVKGALDRLVDLATGRPLARRRQAAWDANAAFVTGLGLDAAAVLGPRPADPVPAPVTSIAVA